MGGCDICSKAKAQFIHTRSRLAQRYGIRLTRRGMSEICRKIQAGKAKCLEKQSNRISLFEIECSGDIIRVAYDSIRKTLATVLPKEG